MCLVDKSKETQLRELPCNLSMGLMCEARSVKWLLLLICLISKMGACTWGSVPFPLFPILMMSEYKKQNTLCRNSPWRQLFHLHSSSLHLTPVFLHGETTACFYVESNRSQINALLLLCQYFRVGFLHRISWMFQTPPELTWDVLLSPPLAREARAACSFGVCASEVRPSCLFLSMLFLFPVCD